MNVVINGKEVTVPAGMSILQFVHERGVSPESVVIEYNRNILDRDQWGNIALKDSDVLEIIHFVGGG